MDWCIDTYRAEALPALREELGAYLRRHAEPASDIGAAEVVFSELMANAVEHSEGPQAWVHVDWGGRRPRVEVHDLGPGFSRPAELPDDPLAEGGRGLYLAAHLGEEFAIASKRSGGAKVSAVLPVSRSVQRSHEPVRRRKGALPSPHEADTDGTFGKEAFLRALVVELGRAAEERDGPDRAEALVAQVGTDVGGRMEEEYRRARRITGRLTPEQMGDLYVRLKAAIDGDFYLIEVDDEKLVLGNRRCPFGDAVRHAPGLCRMTSSVFGGIAARNRGAATVALEERIAVGDPECRVVVWLGDPPPGRRGVGHQYRADLGEETSAGPAGAGR